MAYSFNGSNQSISDGSAVLQGVPVTIAAWVYPTNLNSTTQAIACVGQTNTSPGHRHLLLISATNRFQFLSRGIVGGIDSQGSATAPSGTTVVNTWQHVAGVSSSLSSRNIYVNGVNSGSNSTSITSFNTFVRTDIGANNTGGSVSWYWTGSIADVGIWNVALTGDEILGLSKGMACDKVRPQSLVFYAPLVRNLFDKQRGLALTNNNTATVSDHPRIYL